MSAIERANPDTFYRVFGVADWGNREMLTDGILKDLIEGLSEVSLGNRVASSDILGDAYEYLIWKFADITKRKKAGRPYRAQTKGMVERPIRYLRDSFFYGRAFARGCRIAPDSRGTHSIRSREQMSGPAHTLVTKRVGPEECYLRQPWMSAPLTLFHP